MNIRSAVLELWSLHADGQTDKHTETNKGNLHMLTRQKYYGKQPAWICITQSCAHIMLYFSELSKKQHSLNKCVKELSSAVNKSRMC
jgi:hypothetical protein